MIALTLLLAASAPANLPPFSFMEFDSVRAFDQQSLVNAGCQTDNAANVSCVFNRRVAGWNAVVSILVVDRHLSRLTFAGDEEALPDVISALNSRYGASCETGRETATNGIGNEFHLSTWTWCFGTGKLILHERGIRMDTYYATYEDEVVRPRARITTPDF